MDKTLVIVKPHSMDMHEEIIVDLEKEIRDRGIRTKSTIIPKLTETDLNEFYKFNREKFPWWEILMKSEFIGKSAFAAVYEGKEIIPLVRRIIGPTNVLANPEYTIRGKYGRILIKENRGLIKISGVPEMYRNVIHATDEILGEFKREFKALKHYFE